MKTFFNKHEAGTTRPRKPRQPDPKYILVGLSLGRIVPLLPGVVIPLSLEEGNAYDLPEEPVILDHIYHLLEEPSDDKDKAFALIERVRKEGRVERLLAGRNVLKHEYRIKEEKLRKVFSVYGHVTDCSLKYTKSGSFRRFAFIGYKSAKEAEAAEKQLNKTFINSNKIQVEFCKEFGDKSKPRAWSKYSAESSSNKLMPSKNDAVEEQQTLSKRDRKEKKKKEKMKEMLGDLEDNQEFNEFLEAHKAPSTKTAWGNDILDIKQYETTKRDEDSFDNDVAGSEKESSEDTDSDDAAEIIEDKNKTATKKNLSDIDYLKTKMSNDSMLSESNSESESDLRTKKQKKKSRKKPTEKTEAVPDEEEVQLHSKFVVKMRGMKGNYDEKVVHEFFNPLKVKSIKIPKNAQKKPFGFAYVEFGSDKEMETALRRNKTYLNGKKVILVKTQVESVPDPEENKRPWEGKNELEDSESIAESGRLYLRNLSYCCTEDDLETLFKKYGLLTETNLPVDTLTKKHKGFAFITYMIPEHAVKAYTELDGTIFQGRMLHILPAKPKKEDEIDLTGKSSFKKQKEAKQKSSAKSSHNWNTLFLGANAVANLMAEKYGTTKDQLLDADSSQSLGVRLALGETQLVSETREFLIENGVCLDSFSQAGKERSKTTIIAKNLPSATKSQDLHTVFSKHGTIARIVLPPSGITALIEFIEPTEARSAFMKLAYSKFQHMPLYLEWAPVEVFTGPPKVVGSNEQDFSKEDTDKKNKDVSSDEDDSESDDEIEPESIVFVKNLNFETTEDDLRKFFKKCGDIRSVSISKKKDMKNPGQFLSMGYGFVEFKKRNGAQKAIKEFQLKELNGHQLELKISNRATLQPKVVERKKQKKTKQKTSKILVKNIPFEAKQHEIEEMFKVFGEMKSVRLPKKLKGTGSHRGFGFVDFMTKHDAKRAFNALCHSTHLYGRRLVLEWAETEENLDDLRKKTAEHFHDEVPRKKFKKAEIMKELGD